METVSLFPHPAGRFPSPTWIFPDPAGRFRFAKTPTNPSGSQTPDERVAFANSDELTACASTQMFSLRENSDELIA